MLYMNNAAVLFICLSNIVLGDIKSPMNWARFVCACIARLLLLLCVAVHDVKALLMHLLRCIVTILHLPSSCWHRVIAVVLSTVGTNDGTTVAFKAMTAIHLKQGEL